MVYIVYKTTCAANGKIYVGMHKQPDLNFDGYLGSGLLLHRAIKKHGADQFSRETLFVFDTLTEARDKEREIVTAQFCESDSNYNISVGGTGGNTTAGYSIEEIHRLVKARHLTNIERGNYVYEGVKLEAARARMRAARIQPDNKGRVYTGQARESRDRANIERRGKYKWITDGNVSTTHDTSLPIPEGWYMGRGADFPRFQSHSEDAKQRISEKIKGDICYNDGHHNLKLKVGITPPPGYVKGMIQRHNRKWITDGVSTKSIPKDEDIPEGWKKGRTFK